MFHSIQKQIQSENQINLFSIFILSHRNFSDKLYYSVALNKAKHEKERKFPEKFFENSIKLLLTHTHYSETFE